MSRTIRNTARKGQVNDGKCPYTCRCDWCMSIKKKKRLPEIILKENLDEQKTLSSMSSDS